MILLARDCPFYYRNSILLNSKKVYESFHLQNIFRDSGNIFCDFSVAIKLENEKTKRLSVDENENKENKDVGTGRHKSKNTKRHEGIEYHIPSHILTKLVRSR